MQAISFQARDGGATREALQALTGPALAALGPA
jgi:hypothetical protein